MISGKTGRRVFTACAVLAIFFGATRKSAPTQNLETIGRIGGTCRAIATSGSIVCFGQGGDLVILDMTDPAWPTPVGSAAMAAAPLDIAITGHLALCVLGGAGYQVVDFAGYSGPVIRRTCKTRFAAYDIHVQGTSAFIAEGTGGVEIVDISSPGFPLTRGVFDEGFNVHGVSGDDRGNLYAASDFGLLVVDVKNLSLPTLVSSHPTSAPAGDIALSNGFAYLACGASGLQIFDVSDPSSPVLRGSIALSGALDVAVSGSRAYVAAGSYGLYIIDVSNPDAPQVADLRETPDVAVNVSASSGTVCLANTCGFQYYTDAETSQPTLALDYRIPGRLYEFLVRDGYAYAVGYGLYLIDVSKPSCPVTRGFYDVVGFDVDVGDDFVYLTGGPTINDALYSGGLYAIDVNDPSSPTLTYVAEIPGSAADVSVAGEILCVGYIGDNIDSDPPDGFVIFDIVNPARPVQMGECIAPAAVSHFLDFKTSGTLVYATYTDYWGVVPPYSYTKFDGLRIYDISNPATPTQIGFYRGSVTGYFSDLVLYNNRAYLLDTLSSGDVYTVDVSNPSAPRYVETIPYIGRTGFHINEGMICGAGNQEIRVVPLWYRHRPELYGTMTGFNQNRDAYILGGLIYVISQDFYGGMLIIRYTGLDTKSKSPWVGYE